MASLSRHKASRHKPRYECAPQIFASHQIQRISSLDQATLGVAIEYA
jgi:hypothetical protein